MKIRFTTSLIVLLIHITKTYTYTIRTGEGLLTPEIQFGGILDKFMMSGWFYGFVPLIFDSHVLDSFRNLDNENAKKIYRSLVYNDKYTRQCI